MNSRFEGSLLGLIGVNILAWVISVTNIWYSNALWAVVYKI